MYVDEIISCIEEGREYDQKAFFEHLTEFENAWAAEETLQDFRPSTDHMGLSRMLMAKYFKE